MDLLHTKQNSYRHISTILPLFIFTFLFFIISDRWWNIILSLTRSNIICVLKYFDKQLRLSHISLFSPSWFLAHFFHCSWRHSFFSNGAQVRTSLRWRQWMKGILGIWVLACLEPVCVTHSIAVYTYTQTDSLRKTLTSRLICTACPQESANGDLYGVCPRFCCDA